MGRKNMSILSFDKEGTVAGVRSKSDLYGRAKNLVSCKH
jgi:hypothetical protein